MESSNTHVFRFLDPNEIRIDGPNPSRLEYGLLRDGGIDYEDVKQSFSEVGQLESIVVSIDAARDGGAFRLVAGKRRLLAARALGWPKIAATVINRAEPDTIEDSVISLIENVVRKDPTPADLAHSFSELKAKLIGKGQRPRAAEAYIAVRLGLSTERVHALIRIKEKTIPRLFLAFAGVGGLPLTEAEAARYASLPPDEQEAVWAEWRSVGGRRIVGDDDGNLPKRPVQAHQPMERIREQLRELIATRDAWVKFTPEDMAAMEAKIDALRWVLSTTKAAL